MENGHGVASLQLHSPHRNVLLVFSISAIFTFTLVGASPHHDHLQALTPLEYATQGSKLCIDIHSKVAFETIRIGFKVLKDYVDPAYPKLKKYIEDDIMPSAAQYFSNVLKVRRHDSRLFPKTDKCGVNQVVVPEDIKKNGVKDVDFFAFVTIQKFGKSCTSSTLAYASYCVQDQCDRPIFAHINFCPGPNYEDKQKRDSHIATAIHELTHTLVFSYELFPYFRNSDGTAKFQRHPSHPSRLKDEIRYTCSDHHVTDWNTAVGRRSYVDISAKGMVDVFNERDMDDCPCPIGRPDIRSGCVMPADTHANFAEPRCVVKMKTPKVAEKAKEFFGCNDLQGMELENQPTSKCAIIGSHWEQRLFMGELMASTDVVDNFNIFVSPVTLALFEDSGWYQPDYTLVDSLTKGVHWGYKLGCDFARQKCVNKGKTSFPRFWCTQEDEQVCGPGRTEVRRCKMNQLDVVSKPVEYFSGGGRVGTLAQADYCPYYASSSRRCNGANGATYGPLKYGNANFWREILDDKSKCLESSVRVDKIFLNDGRYFELPHDNITADQEYPNCYKVECADDKKSYKVWILDTKDKEVEIGSCNEEGQKLTPTPALNIKGYVKCAHPDEICGIQLPVYLGGPGVGGKAIIVPPSRPGGGRRPGTSGDDEDDDDDEEDGKNGKKNDSKNGPPWVIIGVVAGVVLLLCIFAAVMCCGRGSRTQSASARDMKATAGGKKDDGVQLTLNVSLNQPANNQAMNYNQPGNFNQPMFSSQPSQHGQNAWNSTRPATQPSVPRSLPAGGWQSRQMAPQAPQYPSTTPAGTFSAAPSWGMIPMASVPAQPSFGSFEPAPGSFDPYGSRSHPFRATMDARWRQ